MAARILAIKMGPTFSDVAEWERLAEDPKAHWSWGKRKRGLGGALKKLFG
jgi:hypothetical protein